MTPGPSTRPTRPVTPRADGVGARKGGAIGRTRWTGALLWVAVLALGWTSASCRGVDPNVLDDRLRTATVDAYLGFLDAEFGGLEASGVTVEALRERHRAEAIGATDPASFYAVMRRMVVELGDPHAEIEESERFWRGPIACPEQARPMSAGDDLWLALPETSIRTMEELAGSLEEWLEGIEGPVSAGDPVAIALLLARSAAPAWGAGAPTAWLKLKEVDGQPVLSPHGASLLLTGRLGTIVEVEGVLDGVDVTLGLFRNMGKLREPGGEFDKELGPRKLARLLDPEVPLPPRQLRWDSSTVGQPRVERLLRSSAKVGGVSRVVAREYGLEARVLISPGGRPVAYLRIGDFERKVWPGGEVPNEPDVQLLESLCAVTESLGAFDDWIVDLTGNHGGRWLDLGTAVSFFVPESQTQIPHEVTAWRPERRWGIVPVMERLSATQARADVPHIEPENLFILVDQGTGSSAEIFAATLRTLAGAQLIGERTVGAELPVVTLEAPDGSRFAVGGLGGMTEPCGHFQGTGLEPDVRVKLGSPDVAGLGPRARRERLRLEALRAALGRVDRVEL